MRSSFTLTSCVAAAALAAGLAVCAAGMQASAASAANEQSYDWARAKRFWSFKPVVRPPLPAVGNSRWGRGAIDRFVLAQIEQKKMTPADEADKIVLLRRATFDLTGLPPTPQEIRAFIADKSPDAYEKLVDRLLASPHYGEQWGRHWLDVARYVQGRITFPGIKNTLGDQAYRDYVVRAFNSDKPYDQFVTEQLAGDLLPPAADRRQEFDQTTAPAFLSIGPWFDECTDPNRLRLEMIDDQINATTQGFLGLTVACARCHDHKFDPIPTADYYRLGGIFRSTRIVGDFSEYWRDGRQRLLRPMAMPDQIAANDAITVEIKSQSAQRWKLLADAHSRLLAGWQANEPKYRAAAARLGHRFIYRFAAENFDGQHNLRIAQLALDGHSVDVIETLLPTDQWLKYKVQVPEAGRYRLEALYSSNGSAPLTVQVNGATVQSHALAQPTGGWPLTYQRWGTVCECDFAEGLNFIRLEIKQGDFPRLDRLRLVRIDDSLDARIKEMADSQQLDPRVLAAFVNDPQQPWPTISGIVLYLDSAAQEQVGAMDHRIGELEASLTPYPLIVSVCDEPSPADLPVQVRGDVYNVSSESNPRGVPRLFDAILPPPVIPEGESGRLQLARWIVDKRNPLTARVMVNRIWQWHFGRGIVATCNDFGARGAAPTHPELLDWLADEFMSHGWSIKHIQRLIMTSSAYRMSSRGDEQIARRDPDDLLLSHFPGKRLEVESLYDAMASTTNIIVRQVLGAELDVDKDKNRAMYVLASNRSPKGLGGEVRKMFALFDYDGSGAPIAQRSQSTTPAQSLFWLNSPLVKHFAEKFAERLLKMDRLTDTKRVDMAFQLALGRFASPDECRQALSYLDTCTGEQKMNRQQAWASLCQALYATVEFRYEK